MGSFSDNDLKRLKERLAGYRPNAGVLSADIWALLARLEAAEGCSEALMGLLIYAEDYSTGYDHGHYIQNAKDALEAWRKSCGKAGE